MKTVTRKALAAKLAFVFALSSVPGVGVVTPAAAGVPVIDGANLIQSVMSVLESIAQTAKQIEEYQTQLQQYENQLRNTLQPTAQVWDNATTTMNRLRSAIDTLNYYKTKMGSIDAYIGRFKDLAAYRNSPCYSVQGCTKAEWDAMKATEFLGSEAQKKANDALFMGLDAQQDNIEADARQLQRLQTSARGAEGQLQAIGYANQLASHQSNQLLQIRALLIAQQNAIITRNQALADREAKESASAESIRVGTFNRSPIRSY